MDIDASRAKRIPVAIFSIGSPIFSVIFPRLIKCATQHCGVLTI